MKNKKIAVIGLGYVGLPLAVEFGKKFEVIGFDINKNRIDLLKKNEDPNLEISKKEFLDLYHLWLFFLWYFFYHFLLHALQFPGPAYF